MARLHLRPRRPSGALTPIARVPLGGLQPSAWLTLVDYRGHHSAMILSTDMSRDDARPYFLWDTAMTVGDLRRRLHEADEAERLIWMGRVMREANYPDVWAFLTLDEVLARWEQLRPRLGRMRPFWEFLVMTWRGLGLIPDR